MLPRNEYFVGIQLDSHSAGTVKNISTELVSKFGGVNPHRYCPPHIKLLPILIAPVDVLRLKEFRKLLHILLYQPEFTTIQTHKIQGVDMSTNGTISLSVHSDELEILSKKIHAIASLACDNIQIFDLGDTLLQIPLIAQIAHERRDEVVDELVARFTSEISSQIAVDNFTLYEKDTKETEWKPHIYQYPQERTAIKYALDPNVQKIKLNLK